MEHYKVTLSEQERSELQDNSGQRHARRLQAHQCLDTAQLRPSRGAHRTSPHLRHRSHAVRERASARWTGSKKKFALEGLALTLNRQRSACEYDLLIDGHLEAQLLALSCSAPPEDQARWSLRLLRLLADRLVELELIDSVSYETVRRTLKKTSSSPGGKSAG